MTTSVNFLNRFEFFVIPISDAQKDDLFANGATITSVVHGPAKTHDSWGEVAGSETLIRCGSGFSMKSKNDRGIVVGRNYQLSRDSQPAS